MKTLPPRFAKAIILVIVTLMIFPHTLFAAADDDIRTRLVIGYAAQADIAKLQALAAESGARTLRTSGRLMSLVLDVPQDAVEKLQRLYVLQPNVRFVEIDGIATADLTPTDPDFGTLMYGPQQIAAPTAWDASLGNGVTVAILDTGLDLSHPEFTGRILPGWDFVSNDNDASDDHGHGTHVTGIAAAGINNGIGMAGMAGEASILPVKVLDSNAHGFWSDVAEGITWAVDNGARVINLSLSGSTGSKTLNDAIIYAESHGVVVVAAAGNSATDVPYYPASIQSVLAVGATTNTGVRWSLSNYGPNVDVMAPGATIYSTYRQSSGASYTYMSGTSMAAPHVAGLVALMFDMNPTLSPQQIRDSLTATAKDMGEVGYDALTGAGLVNADAALHAIASSVKGAIYLDEDGDGDRDAFESTGVEGVPVRVFSQDGSVDVMAVSDSNGVYVADCLPAGNYMVESPEDWPGLAHTSTSVRDVTLAAGTSVTAQDFGFLGPTAVTLARFDVSTQGKSIVVSWQTANESSEDSFVVWRAANPDGPYKPVSQPILAAGVSGQTYQWIDNSVDATSTYWYKLQALPNGTSFGPLASGAAPSAASPKLFLPAVLS